MNWKLDQDLPVTAGSPVYSYLMSPHMQDPLVDIVASLFLLNTEVVVWVLCGMNSPDQ